MKRCTAFLKEPLVHFMLLGAALFLWFEWRNDAPGAYRQDTIVVTDGKIQNLAALFAKTWQRPPSDEELQALVRDYVREEVLYREGQAMGLDRNDTVIRRRIRQKFEFLLDDMTAQADPADEDLQGYLDAHPDAFKVPPRYSFRQIYLNPERRGENLAEEVARLKSLLAGGEANPAELGDRSLLEHAYLDLDADLAGRQFGTEFASALAGLPTGEWCGPVLSGYGFHLVYLDGCQPGRLPVLEEIREAVEREWANARRLEAREQVFRELESRYKVRIALEEGA